MSWPQHAHDSADRSADTVPAETLAEGGLTDAEREAVLKAHVHISPTALIAAVERIIAARVEQARAGEPVIDAAHIEHQRAWSTATFGPREQRGPTGPLAHIRKELDEVAEDPTDLEEWVDVLILAFDGAWRAGHEPQQIIEVVKAKQAKNEARDWPDWRGVPADQAIEHIRTEARAGEGALRHECVTKPLCDGWPFAVDDAYRTIAAVAWPGERKENRDGWAVTMRHRPDLFEQEAARARERLEAAIAHGRAALTDTAGDPS